MIASNSISINDIKDQILRTKLLKQEIDRLTKEHDAIKKNLIDTYFVNHSEFIDNDGIVLAEYKSFDRSVFMTKEFEKDHSDLLKLYTVKNTYWSLKIK